jgi:predicted dinucleotide-utilizing enzyme
MAWERRERGERYYTRSRKIGGRVVREYVGGGVLAELAARTDAEEQECREAEAAEGRAEVRRLEELVAPVVELCEAADVLARAHLIAAGCHKHKGEWRRRREPNR